MTAPILQPERDDIADALRVIRPQGSICLVSFELDNERPRGHTFILPDDTDDAIAWCIEENLKRRNVYFTCNIAAPGIHKKTKKEDMTLAVVCWADCDPQVFQKKGYAEARAWLMEKTLSVVAESASFIIDSGHGLSPFWALAIPEFIDHHESRDAYEKVNARLAKALAGDATQNCDRVMRMPGTLNYPTKKKITKGYPDEVTRARLIHQTSKRYTLEQINGIAHRAELKMRLFEKLIGHPNATERWEGSRAGLADTSDSAMDMSMASILRKLGFEYDEVRELLETWPHSNANGRSQGDRYWERIWNATTPSDDAPPAQQPNAPAVVIKQFSRVDLSDLPIIQEFPPRKWIIEEWLPAGRPALFHAQGGGGKTRVAIQSSITTIINRDFFGWRPARQGSAVLVSGEEGNESIREIVWEICHALQLSPQEIQKVAQNLHIFDLAGEFSAPILYTADGWNAKGLAVLEAIQEIGPAIAFLDNVSACYGGPQTESGHIYGFVNGYSAAVGKEGAAVLLMHENKASATSGNREHAYSGIAAWHNACRSRIEMMGEKGSPNTRKLMRPKANYAAQQADDDALVLEWQRGAFLPRIAGSLVDNMRRENNVTQAAEFVKAVLAVARGPVSPNPRANNNPLSIGRDYGVTCHLSGAAFWAAVEDAVQRGFLRLEKYQKANRAWAERFVL